MPVTRQSSIQAHMARRVARAREVDQASPRAARVRFVVRTTGVGETRLTGKSAIDFGAYMMEEPTFSFGVVALSQLKVGELPQATGVVLGWRRSKSGLYYGADMGFTVESLLYHIRLQFTLTFEGVTLRTTAGDGTHGVTSVANTYNGSASTDSDDL